MAAKLVIADAVIVDPIPPESLPTSAAVATAAPAPTPTPTFEPEDLWTPQVTVNVPASDTEFLPDVALPIVLALLNALLVAYVVHYLTSKRDQRKEVIALQRAIAEAAHEARDTALRRWDEKTQTKRKMLVSQTRMDLQRVGSLVGQLEVESGLRQFKRSATTIALRDDAGQFREGILTDEFEDETLGVTDDRRKSVVEKTGFFIMRLDTAVVEWMKT